MFSTPLTCCSIGAATVSATTWALAPGNTALTVTVGGVICGYCSTGSPTSATAPINIVTNAITLAKTGRSMKNLESTGWRSQEPEAIRQRNSSFIIHHSSFIIHHSSLITHHSSLPPPQRLCASAVQCATDAVLGSTV